MKLPIALCRYLDLCIVNRNLSSVVIRTVNMLVIVNLSGSGNRLSQIPKYCYNPDCNNTVGVWMKLTIALFRYLGCVS